MQLPVGSVDGKTVIGFYAAGSHRIVPVSDCLINADWTKQIIEAFNEYVEKFNIKGFDEQNFTGELREIAVKDVKGNLIITVVTLSDTLRGENDLIEILSKKIKLPFSVYHNVNKNESNAIYGEKFRLVYGKKDYSADMLGVKYKVGVQSFMQVNASVCSKLYSAVREEAALTPETTVIDAYSGAGLMTALLAKSAKKAVGIEIVPEAVDCANALALENGLSDKITNYLGKCEEIMPDIIEKERKNSSDICLVLDPPRKGCDIKVIDAITKTLPEKIIYVSCMPSTLARDAGLITGTLTLNDKGEIVKTDKISSDLRYEIVLVKPFDMFAQTKHIETLVVLSHKKPDSHLEVKIDFDNTSLDKTAIAERAEKRKPQEKTTYKKIQEWIEENYGFKVHTAYVAEVKRELGLPMYDAPNAVEELKRPRQHPTEQMTTAIKAALKHFEII